MVLKEETADVVSFRDRLPRVQRKRAEAGNGAVRGWRAVRALEMQVAEASQVNATSRLTGTRASDPERLDYCSDAR